MKSRIALSFAPILIFAPILTVGHQAHADVDVQKAGQHHHAHPSRVAFSRKSRTRIAMLGSRHNRHISYRHLAVRHVAGKQVIASGNAYGVSEADGWNAAEAGITPPPSGAMIGASVHLTSFEAPMASDRMLAESQSGVASYYGGRHNGRRTSSGRIFNEHEMTAAHATLPFGTKVLVQVAGTDRSVIVTITDRLYARHRIIDLSEGAAEQLGIVREGLAMVSLTPEN